MKGEQAYKHCRNAKWRSEYVSKILKNIVYLGHLVQGKTQRSHFRNGGKRRNMPEEEWIISENVHEALITQEQFDTAAKMARESQKKYCERKNANGDVLHVENPLRRKIYCGQCGHIMYRRSWVTNGIRNYYYYCDSQRRILNVKCSQPMIPETTLMETIRDVTNCQLQLYGIVLNEWRKQEESKGGMDSSRMVREKADLQDVEREKELEQKIMRIKRKRQELYEDMKEGMLAREDFEYERERLAKEQLLCAKELKERKGCGTTEKEVIEILSISELEGSELSFELLNHLIEKIVVFSSEQIDIIYAYTDMIEEWCEEKQITFPGRKEGADSE